MQLEFSFLRSKFANRVLALVLIAALLPVAGLAVLSWVVIESQLETDGGGRLHQASRIVARLVDDRLEWLRERLDATAAAIREAREVDPELPAHGIDIPLDEEFDGLALVDRSGSAELLHGSLVVDPNIQTFQRESLERGQICVRDLSWSINSVSVLVARAVSPPGLDGGVLVAQLDPAVFWSFRGRSFVPDGTAVTIVTLGGNATIASPAARGALERLVDAIELSPSGRFVQRGNEPRVAGFSRLPSRSGYAQSGWAVVLSEPASVVLAPLASLELILVGTALAAVLIAVLLGMATIRRLTEPLRRLQEGNEQLALWDFDTRVDVCCGDEFDQLADSFNTMAGRLGRQFHTLTTMAEIHRSILGALTNDRVVDSVLTRLRDIVHYDYISVTLFDGTTPGRADSWVGVFDPEYRKIEETIDVPEADVETLNCNPEYLTLEAGDGRMPRCVESLERRGGRHFLVLPVFLKEKLTGFIALAQRDTSEYTDEDLAHLRQIADQVTLALSKTRLIEQLDQINLGTLTAFARAIDAKSPWTAGHSERVTNLAVRIGRELGLSEANLDILHRGGLVHDIGKIGIPPEVLDKPGKLTQEEFDLMRQHTLVGARILEPIAAYADIIPIVLQHHERYDGRGYPHGVAGNEIDRNARILGVADCFDAMISDRPYRKGMELDLVMKIITEGAGTQFDPVVVDAFVRMMERERGGPENEAASSFESTADRERELEPTT